MDRWGQYFRPAGVSQRTGDPNKARAPAATAPTPEAAPAPVAETAPAATATAPAEGNASDILAMIRSRQNQ